MTESESHPLQASFAETKFSARSVFEDMSNKEAVSRLKAIEQFVNEGLKRNPNELLYVGFDPNSPKDISGEHSEGDGTYVFFFGDYASLSKESNDDSLDEDERKMVNPLTYIGKEGWVIGIYDPQKIESSLKVERDDEGYGTVAITGTPEQINVALLGTIQVAKLSK